MDIIKGQTDSIIFQLQRSQFGSGRGNWSNTRSHHDTQDLTALRKPVKAWLKKKKDTASIYPKKPKMALSDLILFLQLSNYFSLDAVHLWVWLFLPHALLLKYACHAIQLYLFIF